MSLKTIEVLGSALSAAAKKLPKKGQRQTVALSQISRIEWLVRQCKTLVARGSCVTSAIGSCKEEGKLKVCSAGCGNISMAEGSGYLAIWKSSGDPMAVRILEGALEISSKDKMIRVEGSRLSLRMEGTAGVISKEISIDDVDQMYEGADYINFVLREVEQEIENMLRNLSMCARANARTCP